MQKSPLVTVKKEHGDKAKLVAAVQAFTKDAGLWVDRLNGEKGLARVSNAKLLRLLKVLTEVKDRFGTRAKLIDAVLEGQKRAKDAGLRGRLEGYPVPRLYDIYRTLGAGTSPAGSTSAGSPVGATRAPKASGEASAKAASAPKSAPKQPAAKAVSSASGATRAPAAAAKPKSAATEKAPSGKGKAAPLGATQEATAKPSAKKAPSKA